VVVIVFGNGAGEIVGSDAAGEAGGAAFPVEGVVGGFLAPDAESA